MRHLSQTGRTMLEIISVMGIIGVLSVTGVYMYQKASNTLLADGIIKDVLMRASQAKGNDDLNRTGRTKKMVYTPEYLKKSKETGEVSGENVEGYEYGSAVKGRYGYSYVIEDMTTSPFNVNIRDLTKTYDNGRQYAVVKLTGKSMSPGVCNALRGKLLAFENKRPQVICITSAKPEESNITACKTNVGNIKQYGCPNEAATNLYFTVEY